MLRALRIATYFATIVVLFILNCPFFSWADSLLYKNYVVREDEGREILCDPYVVQRNDYVLKLFRERGEISQKDFHEFMLIFKRMNPEVQDINRIQPGRHIFIPLKKITAEESPEQKAGVISIPFVNIGGGAGQFSWDGSDPTAPSHSRGRSPLEIAADILEARLSNKGKYYFPQGEKEDLELDLAQFPVLEFRNYQRTLILPAGSGFSLFKPPSESDISVINSFWKNLSTVTIPADAGVEEILEAFFRRKNALDTDRSVSFSDNGVEVSVQARWWLTLPTVDHSAVKKIGISPNFPPEILSSSVMTGYLKKKNIVLKEITPENVGPGNNVFAVRLPPVIPISPQQDFVKELLTALKISYTPDVAISFSYGGVQIPATSNTISTGNGKVAFVDFGTFYGDTVSAIEKSGIAVVRISTEDSWMEITKKILTATGRTHETNPLIHSAKTQWGGITVLIPGVLIYLEGKPTTLLSQAELDPAVIRFLNEKGIDVFDLDFKSFNDMKS
jgi:hypothetical protein